MQERSATDGAAAWLLGIVVGTLGAAPVGSVFVGAFCPLFFGVEMRLESSGSSRFGNIPDLRALLSSLPCGGKQYDLELVVVVIRFTSNFSRNKFIAMKIFNVASKDICKN